jgi:hypothetical protein
VKFICGGEMEKSFVKKIKKIDKKEQDAKAVVLNKVAETVEKKEDK